MKARNLKAKDINGKSGKEIIISLYNKEMAWKEYFCFEQDIKKIRKEKRKKIIKLITSLEKSYLTINIIL